jgi:cysteine desulfurase
MFWNKQKTKRIYLDYAAATPVRDEVKKVLIESMDFFANPGTIHSDGVIAKKKLEEAREKIAAAIFSRAKEIIFTGSATESNNLAVFGSIFAWRSQHPGKMPHIIMTSIEHPSILEVCNHLEEKGLAEITKLSVDEQGMVNMKELRGALKESTVFVSVIFASNEIGVIQPIREISKEIRHFKKHVLGNHESTYPLFHTDAAQALLYEDIDVRNLGVELMTISSEKIYGPRGVSVLFVKNKNVLEKILFGGAQESNLRPGTENISAIMGFAEAVRLGVLEREKESARLREIQNYCFEKLQKRFGEKCIMNGSREHRLPNNVNVTFFGFDSELLVIELDACGISVSERSACNTEDTESYVIEALRKENTGSLRISFGCKTQKKDIDFLLESLEKIFKKYKNLSLT